MALPILRAYESNLTTGVTLYVGVLPGQVRPTLSIKQGDNEQPVVLASFHGEKHAQAAINFLDAMFDDINRVIAFHNGEQHGGEESRG